MGQNLAGLRVAVFVGVVSVFAAKYVEGHGSGLVGAGYTGTSRERVGRIPGLRVGGECSDLAYANEYKLGRHSGGSVNGVHLVCPAGDGPIHGRLAGRDQRQ